MLLHVSILRSSSGSVHCSLLKLYVKMLILLLIKRYNLYNVLACSMAFFHLSLFCAIFFQLRTFIFLVSSKTSFSQRVLGLPIGSSISCVCVYVVSIAGRQVDCSRPTSLQRIQHIHIHTICCFKLEDLKHVGKTMFWKRYMQEHFKCFIVKILDYYNITVHSLVCNKFSVYAEHQQNLHCMEQTDDHYSSGQEIPNFFFIICSCHTHKSLPLYIILA